MKNKRSYIKPVITTFDIDSKISLVMMTSEGDIPIDPRGAPPRTQNAFKENPFEKRKK